MSLPSDGMPSDSESESSPGSTGDAGSSAGQSAGSSDGQSAGATTLASPVWLGAGLLLAMAMSPVLQFSIGVLAPFLVEDAGVSRLQVGLYTSTLFVISAVGSPTLGVVVDRLGSRAVLSAVFLLGAVSALLAGAAQSYLWLVASAVVVGLPMALANPVTNRLVRAFVPAGSRGRMMGVKQSGVMVAQTLVGFTVGPIALFWGWRQAFLPALLVAVCGMALTWWAVPAQDPAPKRARRRQARAGSPSAVRWLAVYAMFMGACQACVGTYLPLYAYERVGVSQATAGLTVAIFGVVAAMSRIGWAPAAERARSVATPLRLIALAAAPAVLCIAVADGFGPVVLIIGVIAFGASAPVWNVPGMLAVFRLVDEDATGRASGWIYMGFSCGFVAGPVSFALAIDAVGYQGAWLGAAASIVVALLVTVRLSEPMTRPIGQERTG